MKILKYFLQSLIIYIFYLVILILGLYISRKLFSYLFNIFGPLIRSNKIIESNLLKINKNYKNSEIKKISKKMWNNYSKIFVEYIFLNKFKKQNKHIIIKNKDILDNLLTSKKPIIFVSGHFANFELM
jgi:KDO2-lipid IV(A) lauroyltransferase